MKNYLFPRLLGLAAAFAAFLCPFTLDGATVVYASVFENPANGRLDRYGDDGSSQIVVHWSILDTLYPRAKGLAVNAVGDVYAVVTENTDSSIHRITPTGQRIEVLRVNSVVSNFLMYSEGMAFDDSGNLYVANHNRGYGGNDFPTISILRANGQMVKIRSGVNNPRGITVDLAGNIYLADWAGGRIMKFTPDGTPSIFASLSSPWGLALDSTGNVFATYPGGIMKYTTDGAGSVWSATVGTGLATDTQDNLYVATATDIAKITPDGTKTVFAPIVLTGVGDNRPSYIAVKSNPVPEPSTAALLGIGVLASLSRPRRSARR